MISGGCRCGRIMYESDGKALFSVICHCREWQRAPGSFGLPVMGVSRATFGVSGEPKSYSCTGSSGKPAIRLFCSDCVSLLFGHPEIIPGVVIGSLDDASLSDSSRQPNLRTRMGHQIRRLPQWRLS
jgi:hypothetical protein